jgi:diguanylate cyclase (GGDEF)-like protein
VAPLMYGAWFVQARSGEPAFNPDVDILQGLALVLITPWFAVVGGYISNARRKLMHSNNELAKLIRDLEAAMKTIQQQATHDELTGLFNRRYVMEALLEQARADRTREGFCILLFDLDHFKRINDTYGHLVGDRVLQNFAKTVGGRLRAMDCLGRYGGEEFLLLMPRMSLSNALIGAERLRKSVEQAVFSEAGADIKITVSIGVAPYREGETIEQFIANADRALYQAKSSGRNCVKAGIMVGLDTTVTALQRRPDLADDSVTRS